MAELKNLYIITEAFEQKIKFKDDLEFFKQLLIDILDYLHYVHSNILFEKELKLFGKDINELKSFEYSLSKSTFSFFFNKESDCNTTNFENLGNDGLLGSYSNSYDEGLFILNILRLKVDRNAYPLLSIFEEKEQEGDEISLKCLLENWTEVSDFGTLIKVSDEAEIWDYQKMRNWLENDFVKGKYCGLNGIKIYSDL